MKMVKLLIIADDFTGAEDTGVQLAKYGIVTFVTTDFTSCFQNLNQDAEVLVVDTESRHLPPEEAYRRVFAVVSQAKACGISNLYKKTDSTLRGNIGAEIQAVMDAWGEEPLLFLPAFPKMKRITRNGIQYVDGVPVKDSPFGNDPFTPVRFSSVSEIVTSQSNVEVDLSNRQNLTEDLKKVDKKKIVLCIDAETDADFKEIASMLPKENGLLLAGCAGFAEQLPNLISFHREQRQEHIQAEKILMVCGSLSAVSQNQIAVAEQSGISSLGLGSEQKLKDDYLKTEAGKQFVHDAAKQLQEEKRLILKSVRDENEAMYVKPGESRLHIRIASNMGKIVNAIHQNTPIDLLIVFGGDTIFGIVQALHCKGIMPQEEILPGIVYGKLFYEDKELRVITKAGGFGEAEDLVKVLSQYA